MTGGNANDFLESTTYEECAVRYEGTKYFFHGLILDKAHNKYTYDIDVWDDNGYYVRTVFEEKSASAEECMNLALTSPIFNGKTFWEAEPYMEWVEW